MTLLKMQQINKSFGGSRVLQNVNLELNAGEILGLVGENGAGKSTLIKILSGAYRPDAGTIEIDDKEISIHDPSDSIAAGIAVIYQELTMVPDLSVAENIFLGAMPRKGPLLDYKQAQQQATQILESLNLAIEPKRRVGSLAPGYQQMIEIGRALSRNARVLVMDEPTSSLTEREVTLLYQLIRRLKGLGLGIIYISHHMEEIFEICDRVMVLRDGQVVETRPTHDWTTQSLVKAMLNRTIEQFYPYRPRTIGEVTLTISHLQVAPRLLDVSLQAHRSEIVGIAGVVGSGRSELLKALFGALPHQQGTITWLGKAINNTLPGQAIAREMVLVPEDRKNEGLMLDDSIENNMVASVLNRISWGGWVSFRQKRELVNSGIKQLKIVARGPQAPIRNLSGGNQQKVILARASAVQPRLYLLDEPTRGIDVGAKVEVYNQIMTFAEQGCTVILVSSEIPELLGLCDRVLVLNHGRIVSELSRAEATPERILHLSTSESIGEQA